MKKIKFKKVVWIPLTIILTGGTIGSGVAFAITSFNSSQSNVETPFDESSLSILNITMPTPAKPISVTPVPGLDISYDANHPAIIKLIDSITQKSIENDMLFFMKRLMDENKLNPNIFMAVEKPNVIFMAITKEVVINLTITYKNNSKFKSNNVNLGSSFFEIAPESIAKFSYNFGGKITPILVNNVFGYKILGRETENAITILIDGQLSNLNPKFTYEEPSCALNTKIIGFSDSIGYNDVKKFVFAELTNLTIEDIWKEVHDTQVQKFNSFKNLSNLAQPVLASLVKNPTIKKFLFDNADALIDIYKLTTNDASSTKDLSGIIKSVLKDETLAQIIVNNKNTIIKIVRGIPILAPMMPQILVILNFNETNLNFFFSKDIVDLLQYFGIIIPGIEKLMVKLTTMGLLSLISSSSSIKLLRLISNLIPEITQIPIIIDILSILSSNGNIMDEPIISGLVKVIKSEQTTINAKTWTVLVYDLDKVSAMKSKLYEKDPKTLEKFFDNVFLDGGTSRINPDFDKITVSITDTHGGPGTIPGFKINLTIDDPWLCFSGGSKIITSRVMFGKIEIPGKSLPSSGINGNLLHTLLQSLIPRIDEITMGLLPQVLFNNPKITTKNLQLFLSSLTTPLIDGLPGSYFDFLNSIIITRTESNDANYVNETRHLKGITTTKYQFKKTIKIDLDPLYKILPKSISGIPISLIVPLLPNILLFHVDDYLSVGQKFDVPLSFNIVTSKNKNVARWSAPSTRIIDINMPKTIKSIRDEYKDFQGNINWYLIESLFQKLLPNILYSIKESNGYYYSHENMDVQGIDLNSYSLDIYNGTSFISKYTSQELINLKEEIKINTDVEKILGSDFSIDPLWVVFKTRTVLLDTFDLNSSVMRLFDINSNVGSEKIIPTITYNYIKIMDEVTIFGVKIPEISITALKVMFDYDVYNGNKERDRFQRTWVL